MSHTDRPVDEPRGEGRVLVRDDGTNGVAQFEHVRVRELLSDYLDGLLSPPEREPIRRHLDGCDTCRAFRNTLAKVVEVAAQFPTPRLREAAKQRILDQLLKESSTPS